MSDSNESIRFPTGDIRVTPRQDTPQNQQENKKKKEKKHQQIDNLVIEDLDINELIEFGRLVFKKRNMEMKLFLKLKNKNILNVIEVNDDKLEPSSEIEQPETTSAYASISYFLKPNLKQEQETIDNLSKLNILYKTFYGLVVEESRIINEDQIDDFEFIINKKDEILNKIEETIQKTNFKMFNEYHDFDKKKIKANEIIDEIHSTIKDIIKQEDKNSVELQSLREKMKLDISKQELGVKAVSQYSQAHLKSHFIDKKT